MKLTAKHLLGLALICCWSVTNAKTIILYDAPKPDAKTVGTIDISKGITVIFTPKDSPYLKVADPNNGNVGWIKHTDIKDGDQVTFTRSIIQDRQGMHSYQFVEYGGKPVQPQEAQRLTEEQMREMRAIQKQTQEMQGIMNKTVNDMMGLFFKLGEPQPPRQLEPLVPTDGGAPKQVVPPVPAVPVQAQPTSTPSSPSGGVNQKK